MYRMSSGSGVEAKITIATKSERLATFLNSSIFLLLLSPNPRLKAVPRKYTTIFPVVAPAAEESTSTILAMGSRYMKEYPATIPRYGTVTNGMEFESILTKNIPMGPPINASIASTTLLNSKAVTNPN